MRKSFQNLYLNPPKNCVSHQNSHHPHIKINKDQANPQRPENPVILKVPETLIPDKQETLEPITEEINETIIEST
jgi:hypothetical protein